MRTNKNYTVILNDHFHTVIETNTLTKKDSSGKEVPKYPATARIIDNSTIVEPPKFKETREMVAIDTTPYHNWQRFLKEIFEIENDQVKDLGFEFRRFAIV